MARIQVTYEVRPRGAIGAFTCFTKGVNATTWQGALDEFRRAYPMFEFGQPISLVLLSDDNKIKRWFEPGRTDPTETL